MPIEDRNTVKRVDLSRDQGYMIHNLRLMGDVISQRLLESPELIEDLSSLLHGQQLSYEEIIGTFFYGSGRELRELAHSPFIEAYMVTEFCDDEDRLLLEELRLRSREAVEPTYEMPADFQDWLVNRLPVLARGFQRSVLKGDVIAPLTKAELQERYAKPFREGWETDREKFLEYQRIGSQAAIESAEPSVYTPEVRKKMQEWFDRDLDYRTVIEFLEGIGIKTNEDILRTVVYRFPDLHYTPSELRKKEREGFKEALVKIFAITKSRPQTVAIFEALGYKPHVVNYALEQMKLRTKIDWDKEMTLDDSTISLADIAADFMTRSYSSVIEEYTAFITYLKAKGIEIEVNITAYHGIRRRIRNQK